MISRWFVSLCFVLFAVVNCGGPVSSPLDFIDNSERLSPVGGTGGAGGDQAGGRAGGQAGSGAGGQREADAAAVVEAPADAGAADAMSHAAMDAAPRLDTAPAPIEQLTLPATEDAFVQGSGTNFSGIYVNNSDVNFGEDLLLVVKYRNQADQQFYWRESYIKFDLTSVGTLEKATLRLRAKMSDLGSVSTIEVRELTAAWEEKQVTWSNKPAVGAVVGRFSLPLMQPAVLELEVTSYVKARLQAGASAVSFALTQDVANINTQARIEVDSRETGVDTGPALRLDHRPGR